MNILITGISGLLGSNLANALSVYHRVFGIDRNAFNMPLVCSIQHDVFDVNYIKSIIKENKIDVVIHCVAITNMDYCENNPDVAEKINCTLTDKLAQCCKECRAKLLFISSDAVYDGKKIGLNSEEDVPCPVSIYGKTKLLAEEIVMAASFNNLVFRTNFFGNNYRSEKNSFAESLVRSLRNGEQLRMATDIMFSPLLVNNIGKVINISVNQGIEGVFNLGSTGSISKYEIALEFAKVFEVGEYNIIPVTLSDIPFKAPRTSNMGLDNAKIKQVLGIELPSPKEEVMSFRRLETFYRV